MVAVLEIYDERRPGAKREWRHTLELPADRISARALIQCRVETEVALHNAREQARFSGEKAAAATHDDSRNQWLVTPGAVEQALNGLRGAYGPRPGLKTAMKPGLVDSKPLVSVALEAFARNGFFMIFDGRQVTDPDEILTVRHDSTAIFLKLTPLIGG